jgi:hypothetical protein
VRRVPFDEAHSKCQARNSIGPEQVVNNQTEPRLSNTGFSTGPEMMVIQQSEPWHSVYNSQCIMTVIWINGQCHVVPIYLGNEPFNSINQDPYRMVWTATDPNAPNFRAEVEAESKLQPSVPKDEGSQSIFPSFGVDDHHDEIEKVYPIAPEELVGKLSCKRTRMATLFGLRSLEC